MTVTGGRNEDRQDLYGNYTGFLYWISYPKERDAWMMEQYHMYKISANRPFKTFKEYWEGAEMLTIPIIRMKIFEGGTK